MVRRKIAPNTTISQPPALPNKGKNGNVHTVLESMLNRWEQKEAGGAETWDETSPLPQNKVVNLTAWRSERALRAYCFFTPERGHVAGPLMYSSPDGKTHIKVEQGGDYGVPSVWDADLLDFMITKGREQVGSHEEFPDSITFYATEALKALRKDADSGKNHAWLRNSMRRMAKASIECTFIRDHYNQVQCFNPVSFRLISDGRMELYQVRLHKWFRESIQSGNILATDPAVAEMLLHEDRSGLRKMLLRVIGVRLGKQDVIVFWQDSLMQLCQATETDREFRRKVKMLDLPWDVEFKKEHGRWKVTVSNRTRSHKSDVIPHPVPQKTASHRTRPHKIEGETAPSPTFHRTRSHK